MWNLLTLLFTLIYFFLPAPQSAEDNHHSPGDPPFISADLAKVLYDRKQAVFVDVRGKTAFEAEHIQGAMLFPLVNLQEGKLPPLSRDTAMILYCGCPHGLSEEAGRILKSHGYTTVYILDEGFYGWKEKGYPVRSNPKKLQGFKEWRLYGYASGVSAGTKVFVTHLPTGETESFFIGEKGRFETYFPLYGAKEKDPLEFRIGQKKVVKSLTERSPLELSFNSSRP